MERIKGLIDAPFTPFYENGEVNLEPIEAYAKMLVKNGLQGGFINGSYVDRRRTYAIGRTLGFCCS